MHAQRSSPGVVFVVSTVGGFSFSFGVLAILEIVAPGALHHGNGVWQAAAGACTAIFGSLVVGGVWR